MISSGHWATRASDDKVVGYLQKLNDSFKNFLGSDQGKGLVKGINSVLEGIASGLEKIFTTNIDWSKIQNFSGLLDAFRQVGSNAVQALKETWEANKNTISSALKDLLTFGANVTAGIAGKLFVPVGKSIATGIVGGIREGFKEHPVETTIAAAMAGAMLGGRVGGLTGAGIGAVAGGFGPLALWLTEKGKGGAGISPDLLASNGIGAGGAIGGVPSVFGELPRELLSSRGVAVPFAELPTPFKMKADQMMTLFQAWSGMSEQMATAPTVLDRITEQEAKDKEYEASRQKWTAGEMPTEDWRKIVGQREAEERRARMQGFYSTEATKHLTEIAEMPGEGISGVRAQAYQQLYGIAMKGGEPGKAQDYMTKSLEALVKSFKEQAKENQDNRKALGDNTQALTENTAVMKGEAEKNNQNQPAEKTTVVTNFAMPGSSPWSYDELLRQVAMAEGREPGGQ